MKNQEEKNLARKNMREERAFISARNKIKEMGYNSNHELLVDLTVIGEANKTQGTWVEATDVSDIRTDRVIMSKAQARYYGLEIVDSHEQDSTEGEQT